MSAVMVLVPLTENEIYERMVASILDHRLPPGTKLVEDRLASAFGVSRTRIRPVLVRLANEQVLTLTTAFSLPQPAAATRTARCWPPCACATTVKRRA